MHRHAFCFRCLHGGYDDNFNRFNFIIFQGGGFYGTVDQGICNFNRRGDDADFVFAASTVVNNKNLYKFTASVCPVTYAMLGYRAGCRQKDNKKLDKIV